MYKTKFVDECMGIACNPNCGGKGRMHLFKGKSTSNIF